MSELLEFKNVSKNFGDKEVLKNISFTVGEHKIVGLLGKNGSGKTTIFKLINDLLTPSAGEILVDGKNIGVETKKLISFLPERSYLNSQQKVKDTIDYFADFYEDFSKEKAAELLKALELDPNMKLSKISKGMKEKVQLVLVMSRKVKLYILDEPLGGVDPASRDYILDTILSSFNEDATLLISTHLISDIEKILDEVIFIDNGQIILAGDADELRKQEKASIDEIFRRKFYVR